MSRSARRSLTQKQLRQSGGGNCVEVADGFPGVVPVRDSNAVLGPTPIFPADAWTPFTGKLKRDRPIRPGT
ncbi:DUF397 domain-containing protein [Streptomyces sp. NPDC002911]